MATRTADDQPALPGAEDVKNERVHRAGLRYLRERNKRQAANVVEKAAHESLLKIMKEEKLESYKYGDLEIFVDATEKCKVTKASEPSAAEQED